MDAFCRLYLMVYTIVGLGIGTLCRDRSRHHCAEVIGISSPVDWFNLWMAVVGDGGGRIIRRPLDAAEADRCELDGHQHPAVAAADHRRR